MIDPADEEVSDVITAEMAPQLFGDEVLDRYGERVGKVGQIYLDAVTGQPAWATVRTGLFGLKESFVPLGQAQVTGDTLRLPITKDEVKGAPRVDADARQMSPHDEAELYQYYGLKYDKPRPDGQRADGQRGAGQLGADGRRTDGQGAGARWPDGQTARGDAAMTRSEERLTVGTEPAEIGQVRLRKYVVTEQQQVSVPVRHEEVRLEREPITDANREQALSGPQFTESEHVETLHGERPVVGTEVHPVERVRLAKETVTDHETVSGKVRKERIEVQDDPGLLTDEERELR